MKTRLFFFMLTLNLDLGFAQNEKFWKQLDLSSGMRTEVVESEVVKARILGFHFGVDYEHQVRKELDFYLRALAILETGSNDVNGTVAEFEPNESIQLQEGGMRYIPSRWLTLDLGAINQQKYHSPLLLDAIPFAGISQRLNFGYFYINLQQSVPNNNNLRRRIGSVDTGTPTFLMETFGFYWGKKHKLKGEISHFSYKNLSNGVADNSRTMGNSVSGSGNGTEFLYDFDGLNITLDSSFVLSGVQLELGGNYLYNDKAPDGRNEGALAYLGLRGNALGVQLESFRNESDTSVGFYNSRYYGHNNVSGAAAVLAYRSQALEAMIRLVQTTPLEDNSIQQPAFIALLQITQVLGL